MTTLTWELFCLFVFIMQKIKMGSLKIEIETDLKKSEFFIIKGIFI